MTLHRLEVYLDSYNSKPFVREYDDKTALSTGFESMLEHWIQQTAGRRVDIATDLRVQDIRQQTASSIQNPISATCLRVKLIDPASYVSRDRDDTAPPKPAPSRAQGQPCP